MVAGKQGIFKTIEVLIAIFITFIFLFVFIPQQRASERNEPSPDVISALSQDPGFISCVVSGDQACINMSIEKELPGEYSFKVNISDNPNVIVSGLPSKRVFANSLYVAGNMTNAKRMIVRLYFWSKE
jgi:hypothetical protein